MTNGKNKYIMGSKTFPKLEKPSFKGSLVSRSLETRGPEHNIFQGVREASEAVLLCKHYRREEPKRPKDFWDADSVNLPLRVLAQKVHPRKYQCPTLNGWFFYCMNQLMGISNLQTTKIVPLLHFSSEKWRLKTFYSKINFVQYRELSHSVLKSNILRHHWCPPERNCRQKSILIYFKATSQIPSENEIPEWNIYFGIAFSHVICNVKIYKKKVKHMLLM